MRLKFSISIILAALLWQCSQGPALRPDLIIDKTQLQAITQRYDTTIILFWTHWDEASKKQCANQFVPLAKSIKASHYNCQVVLIAADAHVAEEDILAHRKEGIKSFFLDNPGDFAMFNRLRIKSFLSYCYPHKDLKCTSGMWFDLPLKLMVCNRKLETDSSLILAAMEEFTSTPSTTP